MAFTDLHKHFVHATHEARLARVNHSVRALGHSRKRPRSMRGGALSCMAYRDAVEARDVEAAIECLAPHVVLKSPVAHTPIEGKEKVGSLLRAVAKTFEDVQYTNAFADGHTHALVFRARVGAQPADGIDLVRVGPDGLIEDLTVMVRPVSALVALGQAMGPNVGAVSYPEAA